jgi:hypothetical protein
MRLGKEKATGYVEDTDVCAPADVPISDAERTPVAPEFEQPVAAG